MSDAKDASLPPRPFSAPEGTWPDDEWPVDVQRTDESGNVDLSLVEGRLSLTPAQRLDQLEMFVETTVMVWRSRGLDVVECINSAS